MLQASYHPLGGSMPFSTVLRLVGVVLLATRLAASCSEDVCKRPHCVCASQRPPLSLDRTQIPQFVMLSFDGAVHDGNFPMYRELLLENVTVNGANGCPIRGTFFVKHEYTNYQEVHELWRHGNEMAVNAVSAPPTNVLQGWAEEDWKKQLNTMSETLAVHALVPKTEVRGFRAPSLQTSGDRTFHALSDLAFRYDSSMPTTNRTDPPIWPYTMDYGFQQDCVVRPCPRESYKGLFLVPLVSYSRNTEIAGQPRQGQCSTPDACQPQPETWDDTFIYLLSNFQRHYQTNRAPFPLFLRGTWLNDSERWKGFVKFVKKAAEMDGVAFVTISEVLDFVSNPVDLEKWKKMPCHEGPRFNRCKQPLNCRYDGTPAGAGERRMTTCAAQCPKDYPWV